MSYMDHWADNDPIPTEYKEYRVGIRFLGKTGEVYFHVKARTVGEAKTLAMNRAMADITTGSCLSKGQY